MLRPWRADDLDTLAAALDRSHDHIAAWVPVPDGTFDGAAFLRRCAAPDRVALGIWSTGGALLGGCELRHQDHEAADIGLWIDLAHAGQGRGRAALQALCAHAFDHLHLRRLTWRCDPRHSASRRLAASCGFVEEGVLREARRSPQDDGWIDLVVLSRLWHDPAPGASPAAAASPPRTRHGRRRPTR